LATKAYAQALRVSPSLQRLQNKQTLTENILKAP
jgi:hypothetical protein